MANYEIEPSLLAEFVPRETKLDSHEGKYYVSLVAFNFLDTKVLHLSVPFHTNFEELNLKHYVQL